MWRSSWLLTHFFSTDLAFAQNRRHHHTPYPSNCKSRICDLYQPSYRLHRRGIREGHTIIPGGHNIGDNGWEAGPTVELAGAGVRTYLESRREPIYLQLDHWAGLQPLTSERLIGQ